MSSSVPSSAWSLTVGVSARSTSSSSAVGRNRFSPHWVPTASCRTGSRSKLISAIALDRTAGKPQEVASVTMESHVAGVNLRFGGREVLALQGGVLVRSGTGVAVRTA